LRTIIDIIIITYEYNTFRLVNTYNIYENELRYIKPMTKEVVKVAFNSFIFKRLKITFPEKRKKDIRIHKKGKRKKENVFEAIEIQKKMPKTLIKYDNINHLSPKYFETISRAFWSFWIRSVLHPN
ncbi:MAG: hypothetical protein KKE61_06965, partial [Proteobacteria bacterium]|nr:hypothetical protein [Pseudomonadota bacterium]